MMPEYKIVTTQGEIGFTGKYRRDLETNNWHYYEKDDGTIIHFCKEHMVAVRGDTAESIKANQPANQLNDVLNLTRRNVKMKFELGIEAKDSVTGFKGVITGHVRYLTGCDQYLLTPPVDKEGKHVESRWYDVNRVIALEDSPSVFLNTEDDKGACESAPIK